MGASEDDVIDPELRVRGVEGLRVMDASVSPVMVAGTLNAPMMPMAWRLSDLTLHSQRLSALFIKKVFNTQAARTRGA